MFCISHTERYFRKAWCRQRISELNTSQATGILCYLWGRLPEFERASAHPMFLLHYSLRERAGSKQNQCMLYVRKTESIMMVYYKLQYK